MKNSPASVVKEQFQTKEQLVEAVQKLATADLWIDRVNPQKGLARISNQKLLRLHMLLSDAKNRFGSRGKLIDGILELEKRGKDAGYKQRLEGFALPRLLDLHRGLSRRKSAVEAKAQPKTKKAQAPVVVKKAAAKRASVVPVSANAKRSSAKKASAKKKKK